MKGWTRSLTNWQGQENEAGLGEAARLLRSQAPGQSLIWDPVSSDFNISPPCLSLEELESWQPEGGPKAGQQNEIHICGPAEPREEGWRRERPLPPSLVEEGVQSELL